MNGATVFLVDDDAAVRDSLSLLLQTAGLDVIAYDSAEAFLEALRIDRPACIVLDVRMNGIGGPQLQAELMRRAVPWPIIFLTGHGDIPLSVRTIKAGAFDFLTKPVDGTRLIGYVQAALDESQLRWRAAQQQHSAAARLKALTAREHDVMALAIQGRVNKDIARELGISHRTVEIHKGRIMSKTGARSLFDLARIAGAIDATAESPAARPAQGTSTAAPSNAPERRSASA